MIRDITIGQYYPAKSVIHKLDPRTKLFGTLVFIISVFLFHSIAGYAVATVFLAGMILISTVPVKFIFKGLKAIFMILLITMVFNIFLTPGEALVSFGIFKITKEGLSMAVRMTGLSGNWFFADDIDNDTKPADRWSGKKSPSIKQDSCSGT